MRSLVTSGTQHTVNIKLEVHHKVCDAFNIVLELPGNGSSDEVILVGTHYDTGHFTGAVDNNGSVALMIKLAEHFSSKSKKSRNRDMIFAWCSGHDYDLNSGHYQFAEKHKNHLTKAIVWDVDHALGGTRYRYDETEGRIVPVEGETCEFYIMSNNYTYSRLATFTLGKIWVYLHTKSIWRIGARTTMGDSACYMSMGQCCEYPFVLPLHSRHT